MSEDYPRTLQAFEKRFADEEACRQYLLAMRWPEGWSCPRCSHREAWSVRRRLWRCKACRHETSVVAGTIFQDSHLPLTSWFRAIWYVTNQKIGVSALGLQRILGLGSYKTAWTMLHKLRRAMVRPGRDRLHGVVEVDEAYWGASEEGVSGRLTHEKALFMVAAEVDGDGTGRIRMGRIPALKTVNVHAFIRQSVEPGSTLRTDGLSVYMGLKGYRYDRQVQREQEPGTHVLPRVHRVVSLLKRWLMGTHQGAVDHRHLDAYLDEFTFRFNRRTSASRGKLFYRLVQQALLVAPAPFSSIARPQDIDAGGVK